MLAALDRGIEVYLFLAGMMALAAYAQLTGIFDWMAERAIRIAGSSRARLFALVYAAGIATTALLSNDATIVALTPAVIGALRRFDAQPVPYVVACALVANAASFVLPISNPSNLLVFAGAMPPLATWLATFALPSCAALAGDVRRLALVLPPRITRPRRGGRCIRERRAGTRCDAARRGIGGGHDRHVGVRRSARERDLCLRRERCARDGAARSRERKRDSARDLVAHHRVDRGALRTRHRTRRRGRLRREPRRVRVVRAPCAPWSALAAGFAVAAASNAINNLPVGLNLGETLSAVHANVHFSAAALVGVNLGPNATVNGSLATLLWLGIVRRANIAVSPAAFARIGLLTTIPALAAALLWIHVP